MNASVTFHEAQQFILKQFNKKLELSMVDGRTICMTYNPGLLLPSVSVDIHIEAIQENKIIFTYSCIPEVALLAQGAVKLLGDRVPAKILKIDTQTKSVQVFVDGVEQLKEALKYVKIQDINFESDKINADLLIK